MVFEYSKLKTSNFYFVHFVSQQLVRDTNKVNKTIILYLFFINTDMLTSKLRQITAHKNAHPIFVRM